jgi:hypothetical protein
MGDVQRINRLSRQIIEIDATIKALNEKKIDLQLEMDNSEGDDFLDLFQEIAEVDQVIWDLKVEKQRLLVMLQQSNI